MNSKGFLLPGAKEPILSIFRFPDHGRFRKGQGLRSRRRRPVVWLGPVTRRSWLLSRIFRRSGRGVRLIRDVEILVVDVAELSLPGEPPRALLAASPTTTTVLFRSRNRASSSWRKNRGGGGGCSSAGFVMRKRSRRHLGFREKHLLQKAKLKAVVLNLKYLRISDFQMWSCGSGSSCVVSRSLWSKNFVWIKIQTFGIFYGQWQGKNKYSI